MTIKGTRYGTNSSGQRRDISRLPGKEGDKPKKKFRHYPSGYIHIDIAKLRTAEGKPYIFVAIDRTSKFGFVRLEKKVGKMAAAQILRDLIAALRYRTHTNLTDNGIQFTNRKHDRHAMEHIFDRVCSEQGIEQRLTKVNHPWTNGQVERMNRTIKDATVKRYHYAALTPLETDLGDFFAAYNHARRLTSLRGLTPCEFICKI